MEVNSGPRKGSSSVINPRRSQDGRGGRPSRPRLGQIDSSTLDRVIPQDRKYKCEYNGLLERARTYMSQGLEERASAHGRKLRSRR